jgi:hypothetical protein
MVFREVEQRFLLLFLEKEENDMVSFSRHNRLSKNSIFWGQPQTP